MTRGDERAWWHQALRDSKRGFWEKSLGETLGIPSPTEAARNSRDAERRTHFANAGAAHDAFARATRIEAPPVARQPVAPPPKLSDRRALQRAYRREEVKGIRLWKRAERRTAHAAADLKAERDSDVADEKARAESAAIQADLDRSWERLLRHERECVLDSLADSFGSLSHKPLAYAATADGAVVFVVFQDDVVPYVRPDLTPTGKLTVRKLTKTDRNWLYAEAAAAVTINAVRRALAATPGGSEAAAVTFRPVGATHEPIAWLRISRDEDVGWTKDSSPLISFITKRGQMKWKGRTRAVVKADFSAWPELGVLVEQIERGLSGTQHEYELDATESGISVRFAS